MFHQLLFHLTKTAAYTRVNPSGTSLVNVAAYNGTVGHVAQFHLLAEPFSYETRDLLLQGIVQRTCRGKLYRLQRLVTAIELQMSATTLLQAKSDCLRSKLQYMIEKRMVDYYSGIPLVDVE